MVDLHPDFPGVIAARLGPDEFALKDSAGQFWIGRALRFPVPPHRRGRPPLHGMPPPEFRTLITPVFGPMARPPAPSDHAAYWGRIQTALRGAAA